MDARATCNFRKRIHCGKRHILTRPWREFLNRRKGGRSNVRAVLVRKPLESPEDSIRRLPIPNVEIEDELASARNLRRLDNAVKVELAPPSQQRVGEMRCLLDDDLRVQPFASVAQSRGIQLQAHRADARCLFVVLHAEEDDIVLVPVRGITVEVVELVTATLTHTALARGLAGDQGPHTLRQASPLSCARLARPSRFNSS